MTRNVRTLLFAFGVLLVTGSLTSGVALANEQGIFEETTANYPIHVHGQNTPAPANGLFTVLGNELECGVATVTGELTSADTTVALTPAYSECRSSQRFITVNMNGCQYVFHAGLGTDHDWTLVADLACPGAGPVITTYNDAAHTQLHCTATIKPKSGFTGLTVSNETSATHAVHVHGNLSGIEGTIQGACTFGFVINFNNAVLHVNATVEGTEGKEIAVGPLRKGRSHAEGKADA